MDKLVHNQKRVTFSSPGREDQEQSEGITENIQDNNTAQRRYLLRQMIDEKEARESEFAIAVAATAFAIHDSLDQADRRMKKEALEASKIKAKSRTVEITPELPTSSNRVTLTRLFSKKDIAKNDGEVSSNKEKMDNARPIRRWSSTRHATNDNNRYELKKGMSSRHNNGVESKEDIWERDQMRKVLKRYAKTKSAIRDWENEKKHEAKAKMEERKSLLELRRARNTQHYQNKIVRIEQIAEGARAQLEEKLRNEEFAVKDKAKKMRSRGNTLPIQCFCFTC